MLEKKRKHRSLNAANPQISIKRLKRDVTTLCELFDEFPSSPPNNQQCHTRSSFISIWSDAQYSTNPFRNTNQSSMSATSSEEVSYSTT